MTAPPVIADELRAIGVTAVAHDGRSEEYDFGDRGRVSVARREDGRVASVAYNGLPREGHALGCVLRGEPVTPYIERVYPPL